MQEGGSSSDTARPEQGQAAVISIPAELRLSFDTPYRGWTQKESELVRKTYSEYRDEPKTENKLEVGEDGVVENVITLVTFLVCRSGCGKKIECRKKPNSTKLLEHCLDCTKKDDEEKATLASLGKSAACKTWLLGYEQRKSERTAQKQSAETQLAHEVKKAARGDSVSLEREHLRQQKLTEKYDQANSGCPKGER